MNFMPFSMAFRHRFLRLSDTALKRHNSVDIPRYSWLSGDMAFRQFSEMHN
jgi:hypothetical protein